ncbi:MAG: NAD-dependent protein deacetylase [Wenzhouxiangellaceae bacterium]|nr:NAD-dependent protein deacetylase [Wenzhouxiangellaceae bacterium]
MNAARIVRIPDMRPFDGLDAPSGDVERLARFMRAHRQILVLSGAGCSTRSGIPAYRDGDGRWLRRDPILYQDFIKHDDMRRRYWARSFFGWPRMMKARPNPAHVALAELERTGRLSLLVTQNVDGLHRLAGSENVVELHGCLAEVGCMACGAVIARPALQRRIAAANPDWNPQVLGINPDGDAELDANAYPGFRVVDCRDCGGALKPDVVFFGESVPAHRVEAVSRALAASDALLIVGSSLVVWSGYRIARQAAEAGLPIAAVNNGRTRADALLQFKVAGDCDGVLNRAVSRL